jgi:hypothetical protein
MDIREILGDRRHDQTLDWRQKLHEASNRQSPSIMQRPTGVLRKNLTKPTITIIASSRKIWFLGRTRGLAMSLH